MKAAGETPQSLAEKKEIKEEQKQLDLERLKLQEQPLMEKLLFQKDRGKI